MSAKKPTQVSPLDFPPGQATSFDVEAFDQAIQSQGVRLVHFRAMRCPVGMVDMYDNRRPEHDHSGCSNGFVYTKAGELTALFTGNDRSTGATDVGFMDGSTVKVTAQRFYDGTEKPVHVTNFDRFYLAEDSILVPTWQLFEANISGREKLQFPVMEVQDLMDSTGKRYEQGADFEVQGGYIQWIGQNRPTYDPARERGQICAIRYLYRPYWYCRQLVHQVRVAQAEDHFTGERKVHRMPQAMVLTREYIFEKQDNDEKAPEPDSPEQVPAPRSGSFGPR